MILTWVFVLFIFSLRFHRKHYASGLRFVVLCCGKEVFWSTPIYLDYLHWNCGNHSIDLLRKPHNAPVTYLTVHHFVTEMCTCVHISASKSCIVVNLSNALWYLWDGPIAPMAVKQRRRAWVIWLHESTNNKTKLYDLSDIYHKPCSFD